MRMVIGVLALVVALVDPRTADACSCGQRPAACEALAGEAAFVGTVTNIVTSSYDDTVTFDVSEVFAGTFGKTAVARSTPRACGIQFVVGTTYLVYAHTDRFGTLEASWCSRTAPIDRATEDLAIARALPTAKHELATVAGSVLVVEDDKPRAQAGIEVRVRGTAITARTSKTGLFKLKVPPGRHELEIVSPTLRVRGGATIPLPVASPLVCPKPRIAVAWNGRISGRLTDKAGAPAAGVVVAAGLRGNPKTRYEASTGADGGYVIAELPAGTYDVGVSLPQHGGVRETSPHPTTPYPTSVVVTRGNVTPGIDLVVPPPTPVHRVRGVVRDHDGTPIQGASVTFVWNAGRHDRTRTDEDGRYEQQVLDGSTVRISACWHEAPDGSRCTEVDVTKKIVKPAVVDLRLPR